MIDPELDDTPTKYDQLLANYQGTVQDYADELNDRLRAESRCTMFKRLATINLNSKLRLQGENEELTFQLESTKGAVLSLEHQLMLIRKEVANLRAELDLRTDHTIALNHFTEVTNG